MTTEKTAVAIRVLTAINNRKMPADRDVALLRAYCPDDRDMEPDEMACIVIQRTHQAKKEAREKKRRDPDEELKRLKDEMARAKERYETATQGFARSMELYEEL